MVSLIGVRGDASLDANDDCEPFDFNSNETFELAELK